MVVTGGMVVVDIVVMSVTMTGGGVTIGDVEGVAAGEGCQQ